MLSNSSSSNKHLQQPQQSNLTWSSGKVWQGNWPSNSPPFPGLCVYEGPGLVAGSTYTFAVSEWQGADHNGVKVNRTWQAGTGSFKAMSALKSAKDELIQELKAPNMTKLWNTSSTSVWSRVEPSGFLPTSVSGGYGGITSEFVRDGAGMLIGMLELGKVRWNVVRSAIRFMLHGLQCTQNEKLVTGCSIALNMTRPPEVLKGNCPESDRTSGKCKYNTKIIGTDNNEETDGAFYVIACWGRIVHATNDLELERDYYNTLKTYMAYYFKPGSKSPEGKHYWNASLGLLWTPNLEHSRLTRMWSAYDSLTNSFAVESLRYMLIALRRQEPANLGLAALWEGYRKDIVETGLGQTLNYAGAETGGKSIYAEMLGHVNGGGSSGYPLISGMSWVQTAVINLLVSNFSNAGGGAPLTPTSELGVDVDRLDATFETYAKSGSFLWMNEDETLSALVQTTNVNSSHVLNPPYVARPPIPAPPPPPEPIQSCSKPLQGKAALTIAVGADAWAGLLPSHGACCQKCAEAGPSACNVWFYNGDDQGGRCIFKLDASKDTDTKPSPNFYAGRLHQSKRTPASNAWCRTVSWPFGGSCEPGCPCPARVTIGKGVGWETGWMAHRERWTRLIAMVRWLGAAHHVEAQPLFGEDLDYDCLKNLEQGKTVSPSNGRCWGDPGNGVQIGWWVWGQALLRRKLGILEE